MSAVKIQLEAIIGGLQNDLNKYKLSGKLQNDFFIKKQQALISNLMDVSALITFNPDFAILRAISTAMSEIREVDAQINSFNIQVTNKSGRNDCTAFISV